MVCLHHVVAAGSQAGWLVAFWRLLPQRCSSDLVLPAQSVSGPEKLRDSILWMPVSPWGFGEDLPLTLGLLCCVPSALCRLCFLAWLCPPQVPGLGLSSLQLFIFANTNFCAPANVLMRVRDWTWAV